MSLFRASAKTVIESGGVFRRVANGGVRPIADWIAQKGDPEPHAYARYCVLHFDSTPATLKLVQDLLRIEATVLRTHGFKAQDRIAPFTRAFHPRERKRRPAAGAAVAVVTCWRCGANGHTMTNCPRGKSRSTSDAPPSAGVPPFAEGLDLAALRKTVSEAEASAAAAAAPQAAAAFAATAAAAAAGKTASSHAPKR